VPHPGQVIVDFVITANTQANMKPSTGKGVVAALLEPVDGRSSKSASRTRKQMLKEGKVDLITAVLPFGRTSM
jgi:hypothetical protein